MKSHEPIATLTFNPALDISSSVEFVAPEKKLRCRPPAYNPGGGGINVARAIARLGGAATALYLCGGANGQRLQQLLDFEGIDHRPLPIAEPTRESLTVLENHSGQQYRFNFPGPRLAERDWQAALSALADIRPTPAWIVASGSLPPGAPADLYRRVARIGAELGAKVVIDTSGPALAAAAGEGVYLLKPNFDELAAIAGARPGSRPQALELAREALRRGKAQVLLVSLGAQGALLACDGTLRHLAAPTVPIRSKVGAGDSMVGAVVLMLSRGGSLWEAAQYGVAAGSAAVMTDGTELCRREDVERLYAEMGSGGEPRAEAAGSAARVSP